MSSGCVIRDTDESDLGIHELSREPTPPIIGLTVVYIRKQMGNESIFSGYYQLDRHN